MSDYTKIREELISRGHPEGSEVFDAVLSLFYILDSQNLPDKGLRRLVVDQFHSLETKPSVLVSSMEKDNSRWSPFYLGSAPIGAVVRVKQGAYTSDPGRRFNGLVGRLVSGKAGRAVVRFIGHQDGVGHYLDPKNLEVLTTN